MFVVTVRGIPENPNVTEINTRSGPGLNHAVVERVPVGTSGLEVLDVQPDEDGQAFQGKVHQWFKILLTDRREGWARDDLIDVLGDGSAFGYGEVPRHVIAFSLTRDLSTVVSDAGRETGDAMGGLLEEAREEEDQPRRTTREERTEDDGRIAPVGVRTDPPPVAPPTPAPSPEPTPTTEPIVTTTDPTPTPVVEPARGPGMVTIMGLSGVNMRSGPGTQHSIIARPGYLSQHEILEARQGDQFGDPFKWVRIQFNGRDGWVREDFTRLSGEFEPFGLGFHDAYPSPVKNSNWQRDYNIDQSKVQFTSFHKGWDLAGSVGEPILGGPRGGVVTQRLFCQPCGEQGASALNRGFTLNDGRVLNDQSWNFGFGHAVVVRYDNDILPDSTRNNLSSRNLAGAHLFVIYAHLNAISVQQGQILQPNQQVGTLGNSGNSSGPHLHLEIHAGTNPNATFGSLQAGLMTPAVLFLR